AAPAGGRSGGSLSSSELAAIVAPAAGTPMAADAERAVPPAAAFLPRTAVAAEQLRVPPPDPPPPEQPLRPAVLSVDFPDPALVWGGDRWYAFATSGPAGNVQEVSSTDLLTWSGPTDAVPML